MNILIVDDSRMFRTLISKTLEKEGYSVILAESADDALEKLKSNDINLITLDVQMPGKDGLEACEMIREEGGDQSNVPVIFITGTHTKEYRKRGFELNATDFILKEDISFELISCVNKILRPNSIFEGIKVVTVDDSSMIRKLISSILISKGVEVIEFSDGEAALNFLEDNMDDIDIVITDEEMPKLQGKDLCRKVRKDFGNKDLPIILVSGKTDQVSIANFFHNGATDYLQKPFIEEEFLARLASHLEAFTLRKKINSYMKAAVTQGSNTSSGGNTDLAKIKSIVSKLIKEVNSEETRDEIIDIVKELKNEVE